MVSLWGLITRPLQKTLQIIHDPIQQARIKMFYYVFLLNLIKIIAVIPVAVFQNDIKKLVICALCIVMTTIILKMLLSKPQYLNRIVHLGLSTGIFFLVVPAFFLNSASTLLTIQSVFMICMWSFYALKGKWGFFYSALAAIPLHYMLFIRGPLEMPMDAVQTAFLLFMTILNFSITFTAHYYYSNFLYGTIETKEKLFNELAEVNRTQSLFFSSLSHELRTPLNSVIGMTNLLLDGNESKEQKENLDILKFSAENLLSLINDILDVNKIDSGKVELEAIPFNLPQLLKNACAGLKVKAQEKGLHFVLTVDPLLEEKNVVGDPTRILQIILNLVSNAIKFTTKGDVEIKVQVLKKVKEMVTLSFSIKDTGLGLSEEQQLHIFDPFTQASVQTARKFGGTGLGLSIVKKLVNLHNSSIHVKSELNAGAEFFFQLDYALVERGVDLKVVSDTVNIANEVSALRILLAEDNTMNILFMKKLFSRWGIILDVAENGLEVLQCMEVKDYDLILMDLQMPEMDGFEATMKIREMDDRGKANIYIIAITASVSDDVKVKVSEAGMNDTLSKPFLPDQLYEKLKNIPLKQHQPAFSNIGSNVINALTGSS